MNLDTPYIVISENILPLETLIEELPSQYHSQLEKISANKRRREWLYTRYIVKQIFGGEEEIIYNSRGKPYLKQANVNISISHTEEIIVLLLYPKGLSMGIDIERPSVRLERVKEKFINKYEQDVIYKGDNAILEKSEYLVYLWTAKEAVYKCIDRNDVDMKEDICVDVNSFTSKIGRANYINKDKGTQFYLLQFIEYRGCIIAVASDDCSE